MRYTAFLAGLIERAVAAARVDYANNPWKLRGAVAGLEACRGMLPGEIGTLLQEARARVRAQLRNISIDGDAYWESRCFEAEVEWIGNCVTSAMVLPALRLQVEDAEQIMVDGLLPMVDMTARGALAAASALRISVPVTGPV